MEPCAVRNRTYRIVVCKMNHATQPLLAVDNVQRHFPLARGWFRRSGAIRAVDGVDLAVYPQETVGLVGESGCGKTTLGRLIVRLDRPTAGTIRFAGKDVWGLEGEQLQRLRHAIQMVFQDPYGSLNPRKRIHEMLRVPLLLAGIANRHNIDQQVTQLLQEVGLPPSFASRFPAQLSGGQQQRVAIARAISVRPQLLVADEPLSALDVSVQAQMLRLLEHIRDEHRLAVLFISHDLAVVRYLCQRVLVMYLGRVVEEASNRELFAHPRHPYTVALLSSAPTIGARRRQRIVLHDEPANAGQIPPGCRFHPRCWKAQAICREVEPPLQGAGETRVACHFPE
jgi:oligopeptide/dipeptide ABC transporter ATP-binding protein